MSQTYLNLLGTIAYLEDWVRLHRVAAEYFEFMMTASNGYKVYKCRLCGEISVVPTDPPREYRPEQQEFLRTRNFDFSLDAAVLYNHWSQEHTTKKEDSRRDDAQWRAFVRRPRSYMTDYELLVSLLARFGLPYEERGRDLNNPHPEHRHVVIPDKATKFSSLWGFTETGAFYSHDIWPEGAL